MLNDEIKKIGIKILKKKQWQSRLTFYICDLGNETAFTA
jgi:hypothetical protein